MRFPVEYVYIFIVIYIYDFLPCCIAFQFGAIRNLWKIKSSQYESVAPDNTWACDLHAEMEFWWMADVRAKAPASTPLKLNSVLHYFWSTN